MNIEYTDGRKEYLDWLTPQQAAEKAAEKILDPAVERVEVFRNRHDRRRDEAIVRKQARRQRANDRNHR